MNPLQHANTLRSRKYLNEKELTEYFRFLNEADEKFREYYVECPEEFKEFSRGPEFCRVKKILADRGAVEGKVAEGNRNVVKMSLERVKEIVGEPYKRQCVRVEWAEALQRAVDASVRSCAERKVFVKELFKEIMDR